MVRRELVRCCFSLPVILVLDLFSEDGVNSYVEKILRGKSLSGIFIAFLP